MADTTAPTILKLGFSDVVDVAKGELLAIRIEANDASGISAVDIRLDKGVAQEDGRPRTINFWLNLNDSSWTSGIREFSQQIGLMNLPGEYNVTSLWVSDMLGNQASYSLEQLKATGSDLSFSLTGVKPDLTPPKLTSLTIPQLVDTSNGPVRAPINASATDDASGAYYVLVWFDKPFKHAEASPYQAGLPPLSNFYEDDAFWIKGAELNGSGATTDQWIAAANDVYNVVRLSVTDNASNSLDYSANDLRKMGINSQVVVNDGAFHPNQITATLDAMPSSEGQPGELVLHLSSKDWLNGANTFQAVLNYDAKTMRFKGWTPGSDGSYNVNQQTLEVGSFGRIELSGKIDSHGKGADFIDLHFTPLVSKGTLNYEIVDAKVNLASALHTLNQTATFSIPKLKLGTAGSDSLGGDAGDDYLKGLAGDDTLRATAGADTLDGGSGNDTAVFDGARSSYAIGHDGEDLLLTSTSAASVTRLQSIETVTFRDATLAFDAAGAAGQVYRLYKAAFDRAPDAAGLGFWLHAADSGMAMKDIANQFIASKEFATLYGAKASNTELVNGFYSNVLDRAPDSAGTAFWIDVLDRKATTVADVLIGFAESGENQAALTDLIGQGMVYVPYG